MNDQEQSDAKNENRFMLISVAVVVLIIFGGMGINMLIHHDAPPAATDISNPPK